MKNYSYVTLLTDDSYVCGIAMMLQSMKKVNTKYSLHVLYTEDVSECTLEILNQFGVTYEQVSLIYTPEDIYARNVAVNPRTAATWRTVWTKLRIFDQTQFDKIVALDNDIIFLKNLDHLFEKPHMTAALDGEYFNIWPNEPHFNSGCMVIEPNHKLFEDILNFAINLKLEDIPNKQCYAVVADQEIMNMYFNDWFNKKELHLNKYYNIFGPYIQEEQVEDIKENGYFIHFIGRKPWAFFIKPSFEHYSEYFYVQAKKMYQEKMETIDWKRVTDKVIVTVYAICKNEKERIHKWLDSFGIADYVCVLDTGSEDGTWEILQEEAKKRNNLIIEQKTIIPWRYDTARNESMKLIPKNTVMYFMADIDEVIKESNWIDKVRSTWHPTFNRGMYTYNRNVDENDFVIRAIKEYRIHNKKWTHWENVVHEALINDKGEKQFYIESCTPIDITVWHYPKDNKEQDYVALCERAVEDNPEDWIMQLQLAIEYEIKQEWDKADKVYELILSKGNNLQSFELARCYTGIGKVYYSKKDYKRAMDYFREGRLRFPYFADNYLCAAEIASMKGEWDIVIELCKAAMKNSYPSNWCSIFDINSYFPFWLLGVSYYNLGNREKGFAYLTIAAQLTDKEEVHKAKQTAQDKVVADLH